MDRTVEVLKECGSMLPFDELLAALSEECVELSHAALKYRRALNQINVTPKKEDSAYLDFLEELCDVFNVIVSAGIVDPKCRIMDYCDATKADRWKSRLIETRSNSDVR